MSLIFCMSSPRAHQAGIPEKVDQKRERTHLLLRIPARGLVGLESKLLSATRGTSSLHP